MTKEIKAEKYSKLLKTANSVLVPEDHCLSRMANCCVLIQEEFNWLWVGFYLYEEGRDHLYLGPYQGPLACTQIPFSKGVCGASFTEKKTMVVPNVENFPGHIACSGDSKSEIVVPIKRGDMVIGVLDIDSVELSSFDEIDQKNLETLVQLLSN